MKVNLMLANLERIIAYHTICYLYLIYGRVHIRVTVCVGVCFIVCLFLFGL